MSDSYPDNFLPYYCGAEGETCPTHTRGALAAWFDGFAVACREARQGVRPRAQA
jgi:hypothetical protein